MSERESKIYNIIIIVLVIAIIVSGIYLFAKSRPPKIDEVSEISYNIVLQGNNYITLYVGENYKEEGFTAFDSDGNNISNRVEVISNVDTSKVGTYEIIYRISDQHDSVEQTRTINVIQKTSTTTKTSISFKLKGNSKMEITLNSKFTDPGFSATSDKKDLKKYVVVSGNVDTSKVGTYKLTYTLNYNNQKKTLTRQVNVINKETEKTNQYSVKLSTYALIKGDVIITIQALSKDFSYFVLPNGSKSNISPTEYKVSSNGTYIFNIYNKNNVGKKIEVVVSNVDNTPPKGTCKAVINSNNTTSYTVTATDENGIAKIVHNDKTYNSNFTLSGVESNGKITLYDKVGNITTITCTTTDNRSSTPTPTPVTYDNLIDKYESSTLKYWIEKPNDNYTITHIWVKDAYKQMKTAIPKTFGSLATARTILDKEISNNGYSTKGIFAVNASSIVSDNYNTAFKNKISAWNNTSTTPIVIVNGEVKRNFTNKEIYNDGRLTVGLKSNYYLQAYNFDNPKDITTNTATANKIISDGVKYTFGSSTLLVSDGVKKSSETDKNLRQSLCQIDKNNFAIITNITSDKSKGLSYSDMASIMTGMKCKYGFNLDGGQSINAFYKKNTSSVSTLKSSSRTLVDILYFAEQ